MTISDEAKAFGGALFQQSLDIQDVNFFILIHALLQKGVIDFAAIQEAISLARDLIPKARYSSAMKDHFEFLEQLYRPGRTLPLRPAPPDDPQP
jgi:hypothetical protein